MTKHHNFHLTAVEVKGDKTPHHKTPPLICCSNEVKCHVLYVPERKGGEGKAVTALHIQLAQVIGLVPFSSDFPAFLPHPHGFIKHIQEPKPQMVSVTPAF